MWHVFSLVGLCYRYDPSVYLCVSFIIINTEFIADWKLPHLEGSTWEAAVASTIADLKDKGC